VPRILPHREHVSLHRLWGFSTLEDSLTLSEHAHVLRCAECSLGLRTCLEAESFGTVLRLLHLESDESKTLEEAPRLRLLYVIPGDRRTG